MSKAHRPVRDVRKSIRVLSLVAIIIATVFLATSWWLGTEAELRETELLDSSEVAAGHEQIARFFEDYPHAVAEGLFALDTPRDDVLIARMERLERVLDDDYLFEVRTHNRKLERGSGKPGAFSLHEWIADSDQAGWRRRLQVLLNHDSRRIRDLAASLLAGIATKVPECLASEPLPGFGLDAIRELLRGLAPDPGAAWLRRDASPDFVMHAFLVEALRSAGTLRVWREPERRSTKTALPVLLQFLTRSESSFASASVGEALGVTRSAVEGPALDDWHLTRARTDFEAAEAELIETMLSTERVPERRVHALRTLVTFGGFELGARLEDLGLAERLPDWLDLHGAVRALRRRRPETFLAGSDVGTLVADLEQLKERAAYSGAWAIFDEGDPVATRLLSLAEHEEPRVRHATLAAIASFHTRNEPVTTLTVLTGLLEHRDFRTANAAARAAVAVTGRWPDPGGPARRLGGRDALDPLPLEVAVDRGLVAAVRATWNVAGGSFADHMLDALRAESADTIGKRIAARRLAELARRGGISSDWLRERSWILLDLYRRSDLGVRAKVLRVLAAAGNPWDVDGLWSELDAAMRRSPSEVIELLITARALLRRGGQTIERQIETLLEQIEPRESATAAAIHAFTVSRYGAAEVDAVVLRRAESAVGAERANLVRFFPATSPPKRVHLERLVDFLGDADPRTRFWALERLSALSGGRTWGFDPKHEPGSGSATRAIQSWREWAAERE